MKYLNVPFAGLDNNSNCLSHHRGEQYLNRLHVKLDNRVEANELVSQ